MHPPIEMFSPVIYKWRLNIGSCQDVQEKKHSNQLLVIAKFIEKKLNLESLVRKQISMQMSQVIWVFVIGARVILIKVRLLRCKTH